MRRIVMIPNAVNAPDPAAEDRLLPSVGPSIVAIGRLVKLKGFDRLLRAFAASQTDARSWSLCIMGDGPERGTLERLANSLGISDRFYLPGRVRTPSRYLPQFEFAALTSEYEGFPNAIGEAMAVGLPVVSFDCPYGPRAIIRDGVDGFLVPPGDESALARAFERLMRDDALRRTMGSKAKEVTSRFDAGRILAAWDEAIGMHEGHLRN